MAKANHLQSAMTRLVGNMCFGRVVAVIGATATAFTTTGTPAVSIDGVPLNLTAQTNTALSPLVANDLPDLPGNTDNWLQPSGLAGFYTQPAGTTAYYVIGVNAAGTWRVVQGTYDQQPISAMGLSVLGRSEIPDVPQGFVPVTVLKVVSGGAAFIPGTTALTGIGTFRDVTVLPVLGTF